MTKWENSLSAYFIENLDPDTKSKSDCVIECWIIYRVCQLHLFCIEIMGFYFSK